MLTMTITWPSFTYTRFSILLYNLILEKLLFVTYVESNKFFLVLSFLGFFCLLVFCVFELLLLLFLSQNLILLVLEEKTIGVVSPWVPLPKILTWVRTAIASRLEEKSRRRWRSDECVSMRACYNTRKEDNTLLVGD